MLTKLPNEVIRLIGLQVYDTLALTQEERLGESSFLHPSPCPLSRLRTLS
jgi:hypothetical protein